MFTVTTKGAWKSAEKHKVHDLLLALCGPFYWILRQKNVTRTTLKKPALLRHRTCQHNLPYRCLGIVSGILRCVCEKLTTLHALNFEDSHCRHVCTGELQTIYH